MRALKCRNLPDPWRHFACFRLPAAVLSCAVEKKLDTEKSFVERERWATPGATSLRSVDLREELRRQRLERRYLEEALRRSEGLLAASQRQGKTGTWTWNVTANMVDWSQETCKILGYDVALQDHSIPVFVRRIDEGDRVRFESALRAAVRLQVNLEIDYRLRMPDGSLKYVRCTGRTLPTVDGELEVIGTITDVTEHSITAQALRHSEGELARMARLTTLGELVVSIAHEVNQPLAAIVANGDAALRWLNRDPPNSMRVGESIEAMVRDGLRASGIVTRIRSLTKKVDSQRCVLDLNELIREASRLLEGRIAEGHVQLQLALAPDLNKIVADRVQLQQVVINLLLNACEAMDNKVLEERLLSIVSFQKGDEVAIVEVSDTGMGVDPAVAGKIFDSFFSTKRNGLGVGLSISRSIVRSHGGDITFHDRDNGTTFRISMPLRVEKTS